MFLLQKNLVIDVQSNPTSLMNAEHSMSNFSSLSLLTYLSTGPVSFRGVLQLKLAEVGLGRPISVK